MSAHKEYKTQKTKINKATTNQFHFSISNQQAIKITSLQKIIETKAISKAMKDIKEMKQTSEKGN